ncbi:MAG: hypothetical protein R2812_09635 [Gelidibacter sp.]
MKHFTLFLLFICFSCGKGKVIQLPEIKTAKITEVFDVSPAYLFYDETQPDSIELNQKNLISTTNWLVNIDKRLYLKQVIPKIKLLQDKKRNAKMHKNEHAKNYYTCNDTQIKSLGFIDFTDIVYHKAEKGILDLDFPLEKATTVLRVQSLQVIKIQSTDFQETSTNVNRLIDIVRNHFNADTTNQAIILAFDKNLTFQDYITFKSTLETINTEGLTIDHREFIY